jgi:hypothetical protein
VPVDPSWSIGTTTANVQQFVIQLANQGSSDMQYQPISEADLPKGKRTTLKLYVTSIEAYGLSKAYPNQPLIRIDQP